MSEGNFFSKIQRLVTRKERNADQKEALRQSPHYERLKKSLEGKEFPGYFGDEDLSFGEVADTAFLYLEGVQTDPKDAVKALNKIAQSQFSQDYDKAVDLITRMISQGEPIDPDEDLYKKTVSIEKIIQMKLGELSHYPGGIKIKEKSFLKKDRGKYVFWLSNRQNRDKGEQWVKEVMEETGVPVISNIND